jgi:hypothetical protein
MTLGRLVPAIAFGLALLLNVGSLLYVVIRPGLFPVPACRQVGYGEAGSH